MLLNEILIDLIRNNYRHFKIYTKIPGFSLGIPNKMHCYLIMQATNLKNHFVLRFGQPELFNIPFGEINLGSLEFKLATPILPTKEEFNLVSTNGFEFNYEKQPLDLIPFMLIDPKGIHLDITKLQVTSTEETKDYSIPLNFFNGFET